MTERASLRVHLVSPRTGASGIPELADLLRASGDDVTVSDGQHPELVTKDIDLVVGGGGVELARATELGIACKSFADVLRERFLGGKRTLLVAGGHGRDKTLMAAMCASILEKAGLEPGFLLRGRPANFDVSARAASTRRRILGGGAKPPPFIIDGELRDVACLGGPEDVVLITGALQASAPAESRELGALVEQVPEAGIVAVDARDADAYAIVERHARCGITTYAIDGDPNPGHVTPTWLAAMVRAEVKNGAQPFDLFASGSSCGRFALRGLGPEDVRIAIGAIAACTQGFGIDLERARAAIASFEGLREVGDGAPKQ
jgi:UDP-N-acetylmuramate: L-alanyl-gamma-D-glutamyl-meso-diaminopimelate ligase